MIFTEEINFENKWTFSEICIHNQNRSGCGNYQMSRWGYNWHRAWITVGFKLKFAGASLITCTVIGSVPWQRKWIRINRNMPGQGHGKWTSSWRGLHLHEQNAILKIFKKSEIWLAKWCLFQLKKEKDVFKLCFCQPTHGHCGLNLECKEMISFKVGFNLIKTFKKVQNIRFSQFSQLLQQSKKTRNLIYPANSMKLK